MADPRARRPATLRGGILVAGTGSGAGKSTVTAGLCRWLRNRGVRVAPFKAQNMSNHAAVSVDGGEVGRAQATQAAAAGVDVETTMNPVLLKPSSVTGSHVVVLGREVGVTDAHGWGDRTAELRPVVLGAFSSLRQRFDVVVAEGAGGAAEINLLARDLVNLPFARAAGIPTVLVVDIERGGAFAAAHGTIDLVPPQLAATVAGIVINRFRGDPSLLKPGIVELEARTGVPVLGVLPHLGPEPLLGTEDSLDVGATSCHGTAGTDPLRVVAVRLPHLANPSDLDPLMTEPDVSLTWATRPADLRGADLVVLPGSRATVDDLAWLHRSGVAEALVDLAGSGAVDVLAVCAGQQMAGRGIVDHVESGAGAVRGLGLLPVETVFGPDKVVARRRGSADTGSGHHPVSGYQIHHGRSRGGGDGWLCLDEPGGGREVEGSVAGDGAIRGTSLHGILDDDAFRGVYLSGIAERRARTFSASPVPFDDVLEAQHERLAHWLESHLDLTAVTEAIARSVPAGEEPGWS